MLNSNKYRHLGDEELLTRYRNSGDNEWLGYLLQRYTALLFGVAVKYLKERDTAEDAVQHIFETALTHFPAEPVMNFKGWLYVLMRNHCLHVLRQNHHSVTAEIEELASLPHQEEDIAWKEYSLDQMNMALDQLNVEQQQTIRLFYLEQHSYDEIIEKTGFTFMQVKSYIQNGKRNLKQMLMKKLGR